MFAIRTLILGSMALALAACSPARQGAPDIELTNGWSREVAPGQSSAAAYVTISNKGAVDDRLTGVQLPVANANLHETSSAGGVARMRALEDGLEVPAGSAVELKPGGTHIMLTGLADRPAVGETIALTLNFERSGNRTVAIRIVAAGDDGHSGHGMTM